MIHHLAGLRLTVILVIKREMDPPSFLYPLTWWVTQWRGGLSLSGTLMLLLVHGLSTVLSALAQRETSSDPLSNVRHHCCLQH